MFSILVTTLLNTCSIEEIQDHVRAVAATPPAGLRELARESWEYARQHHSRQAFVGAYRRALRQILGERRNTDRPHAFKAAKAA